jgi:hypothetical protein
VTCKKCGQVRGEGSQHEDDEEPVGGHQHPSRQRLHTLGWADFGIITKAPKYTVYKSRENSKKRLVPLNFSAEIL